MRAGCRCENVVFVFLSCSDPAGCAFEGEHSSNDHCVAVYGSIIDAIFNIFFRIDRPFRNAIQFSFSSLDSATIIRVASPKRLGMNKLVRTKSHTGNELSQISLGFLCT